MDHEKKSKSKLLRLSLLALGGAAIGMGAIMATPSAASAQAAYGSYIGIGGSLGVTSGPNDGSTAGGVIAVRYKFLEVPISLRTQFLISGRSAVVPVVSYDVPLNWQTDAYIGAGASIPFGGDNGTSSPVGDQAAFVLQPGIDYSFPYSNLVIFGNAIIAFDAYKDSNDTAAALQGGVGVRF